MSLSGRSAVAIGMSASVSRTREMSRAVEFGVQYATRP